MADRTVSVRLAADVGAYQAAMQRAARSTQSFARDVKGEFSQVARHNKQEMTQIGTVALAMGAAAALGLGLVVRAAADFDRQMSQVAAVAGASAQEMGQLSAAAIQAGKDTAFSAAQSAQAISELTKAGVSTADVLGGALRGSLDLAAAGGLELSNAATIASQALNIFKLEGADTTRVADTLAAGANKSAADVTTLGDALRQGGLLAAQTGLDLETTVGALSLFADNALVGSDAGTSLKTMLQRLVPQSEEARRAMDDIGFSAFDVGGSFVGLESVAAQLQEGLAGLSDEQRNTAMNTIFGADAVRAAAVLMDAGAEGVREYTDAVTDQGAAAEMAAIMLDNLAGDVQIFAGSVETAMIEFGEESDGALRKVVQFGTSTVNALADLPDGMQAVAMGLGGVASAAGIAGGGFLLAAPRIADTKDAFDRLATSMPRTIGGFRAVGSFLTGPWGLAVGAAVVGLGLLWNEQRQANDRLREASALLDENTGALLQNAAQTRAVQLQQSGLAEHAERFGISLAVLTSASMGNAEAQDAMARSIDDNIEAMRAELDTLTVGTIAYDAHLSAIERAENQSARLTGAVQEQAGALEDETEATIAAAEAAHELRTSALGLGIAFEDLRNDQYQLLGATDGWTDRLVAAADATVDTGRALTNFGVSVGRSADSMGEFLDSLGTAPSNLSVYNGMLSDLNAANRKMAEETAAATEDAEDSWEDYFTETTASAGIYLQGLHDQVAAQNEWADLIAEAQARGLDNVAAEIIAAGPGQNELYRDLLFDSPIGVAEEAEDALAAQVSATIAAAAHAVNTDGIDFIDAYGNVSDDAVASLAGKLGLSTDVVRDALDAADVVARERGQVLQATFDQLGADSTAALALRLREGVTEILQITGDYADAIAWGSNPTVQDLGQLVTVTPAAFAA